MPVSSAFPDELNEIIGMDDLTLTDILEVIHIHFEVNDSSCGTK